MTRRSTSHSPTVRVAMLAAVLAVTSAILAATLLRDLAGFAPHTRLPWWMLVAGFLSTELFTIHVDMRRDTYSISMMELPLVVGLFLVSPLTVLAARLGGSALALVVKRRQVPIKVAFNFALYSAETVVAIVVFRALAGTVVAVDPHTWLAAFVAMLAANVVSVSGVMCAMRLHGADLSGRVPSMLGGALIPPVANTSLALAGVILVWDEPGSAWLLAAIAVVLGAAYRGYASLNQRYSSLQGLYDFTRRIQSNSTEESADDILRAAAELMRAERAELVVVGDDGVRRCTYGPDGSTDEIVDDRRLDDLTRAVLESGRPRLVASGTRRSGDASLLASAGWRDAIAVPVLADGDVTGVMTVADRADDVSTFDRDDLKLFQALVNHSAMAFDNAQLVGRLRHDALHDALTGLPNRTLFHHQVRDAITRRQPGTKLAVMLMDLDRFKEVNDTLGHHYGDQLLGEVGRRLAHVLDRGGSVARLGGDEFALLMPVLEDGDEAMAEARLVRGLLREPFELGELNVDVNGTIGIALSPDHGEDAATLLQRADVAMYAAKAGAGIELYTSERDHYSPRRLALVGELRDAIEHEQLVVHYQPKIDVATGGVVGVEALLRWPHPTRGLVPPDEFIPIAEHTGVIRSLTLHVLRRAAVDCARWRSQGHEVGVAVNVSARNLLDVELIERLRAVLAASNVPPRLVTLEITESSLMGDTVRVMAVLEELSRIGVRISIDDFGTGYSSLTYLKQLPVDEVKIDKSFVQTMETDTGDAAIVRSVIELGANLGMTVVAEGVESATTLEHLRSLGCSLAQGYLISRPVPYDELIEWMHATQDHTLVALRRPTRRGPLEAVNQ